MAKRSMASLLPRYDASRMLGEYVSKFYLPAVRQGHRYIGNGFEAAKTIAAWKARVRAAWPGVTIRRLDGAKRRIQFGDTLPVEVGVKLNGLSTSDVCVELILSRGLRDGEPAAEEQHAERARRRILPLRRGHRLGARRQPGDVLRLRIGAAAKRRMPLPHGDERAHELEQFRVGMLPVEPRELAVVAIGVV